VTKARIMVAVTVATTKKMLVTVRSSVNEAEGGGTGVAGLVQGIAVTTGRATKVDRKTKGLVTRELKEERAWNRVYEAKGTASRAKTTVNDDT
jgi:hypothetical protein